MIANNVIVSFEAVYQNFVPLARTSVRKRSRDWGDEARGNYCYYHSHNIVDDLKSNRIRY
jgi:hypothetical protein